MLRVELETNDHTVSTLTTLTARWAVNNAQRVASLTQLRRLARKVADKIDLLGYHDFIKFRVG